MNIYNTIQLRALLNCLFSLGKEKEASLFVSVSISIAVPVFVFDCVCVFVFVPLVTREKNGQQI